jgi:hypothetical protein
MDQVLYPLNANGPPAQHKPALVKKLRKGDAYWETPKHILGWILNSVTMMLELLPHCHAWLMEPLDSIPTSQHRLSIRQ